MFAVEWLKQPGVLTQAERIGASLAAGLDRVSGQVRHGNATLAALLRHGDARRARTWRPARAGPLTIVFTGHIDNRLQICAELGLRCPEPGDQSALAAVYGHALLAWGDQTDIKVIGEYAAAVLHHEEPLLRLSRSPLRAPPLHYWNDDARVVAATAVRALFACGIERRLNDEKLADMARFRAGNEARGWYHGVARVPLGTVVKIGKAGLVTQPYYDPSAQPRLPRASAREYLEQAHALLAEGTRAALAGSNKPAIMLSGGLDSALIATRALDVLPAGQAIDTYTFTPVPAWDGTSPSGYYGSERPRVEALCTRHPRLRPHFHDNADRDFTARLPEMFHTIGGAPHGLCNLAPYHSLWEAARADGCDRVLLGEFGNATASADGSWAYSEYLVNLRWGQLYRALRIDSGDGRSPLRRFLAMAVFPFLPDRLWSWQRRLRGVTSPYADASPLRADFYPNGDALPVARHPQRDRMAMIREIHDNTWGEFSDIYSGFEQLYGMEQRDPTAYRPFFEFCAGLPSTMFLRDGQERWLARALLRGRIPDEHCESPLIGSHNADWHARLSAQRGDLIAEIGEAAKVQRLAAFFDYPRLQSALADWPDHGDIDTAGKMILAGAIPRAVVMARFIDYVEGRNET